MLPEAGPEAPRSVDGRASRRRSFGASGGWPTVGCRRSSLPDEAAAAKAVVEETAAEHEREHRSRALRRADRLRGRRGARHVARAAGTPPSRPRPDRDRAERDGRAARPHQRVLRRRLLEVRRAAGR